MTELRGSFVTPTMAPIATVAVARVLTGPAALDIGIGFFLHGSHDEVDLGRGVRRPFGWRTPKTERRGDEADRPEGTEVEERLVTMTRMTEEITPIWIHPPGDCSAVRLRHPPGRLGPRLRCGVASGSILAGQDPPS